MPRYLTHDRHTNQIAEVTETHAIWIVGNHSDYQEERAKTLLEHTDQHTMIYLPMLGVEIWREE